MDIRQAHAMLSGLTVGQAVTLTRDGRDVTKRICDWHQCTRVADYEVRADIPHPRTLFTTLMWWRCGDHIPPLRAGTKLTDLRTGDVQSLPMERIAR